MIRVVSLVKLTDEGERAIGSDAWQTAGIYEFVAVLTFPDLAAEFRSRNEVYKLGTIRVDHVPAIPREEALELTSG